MCDGPVQSPVDLTLMPEHRRGHGSLYGALNCGGIDVDRLRTALTGLPLPRVEGGRLVLAVDVSPWLRSDAPCSDQRLLCHVYGRAKSASQFIPGRPWRRWGRGSGGDRGIREPKPPRVYDPNGGRPPKHGPEFRFALPAGKVAR